MRHFNVFFMGHVVGVQLAAFDVIRRIQVDETPAIAAGNNVANV
jgi:hypothetical protein